VLSVGHFLAPFFLLIGRTSKRMLGVLAAAVTVLLVHVLGRGLGLAPPLALLAQVLLVLLPVTTSRLTINERVPCRMYSNSRRSTLPQASGRPVYFRSNAWTPVSSSVLTVRSPCSARAGASV